MIILDYVTNCTTVNPQESQMTSVITSKRTKGKRGLETALGNKIFLTFSTSNQTIKKEFLHFEQPHSATFVRYEGGHLKLHHHYPEASKIRLKKVEQAKKKNGEKG